MAGYGPVATATVVAVSAMLGGAFFPGQRLVLGFLLALLLGFELSRRLHPAMALEEKLALVLVAWGVVSAVVAGGSPLAAKETIVGWLIAWCVWVIARRSGERPAALAAVVLLAAAMMAVAATAMEALGRGDLRVGGLMDNPNITAALVVVMVPLAWWRSGGSGRFWPLASSVVLVAGVALTGSRAGLLALLAAGAVALPRGRVRIVGVFGGALGVVAVLGWRFIHQPDVLAWFRPAIWSGVLRLWLTHPICGVGPGGLADAAGPVRLLHADHVGQRQFLITYAESSPLGLLVQTGVMGAAMAILALCVWFRVSRHNRALENPRLRAVLAAVTMMAAFHDYLTIEIVLWWWALVIGLLESGVMEGGGAREGSRIIPSIRGLAFAFVVLWGVVQPAWARWMWRSQPPSVEAMLEASAAEPWYDVPHQWRARALLDEREWGWQTTAEALAAAHRATRARPGRSGNWMTLGQVHFRIINELGAWPDSVAGAREAFSRASALEPHQPWPWLEWARFERGLGNLDQAASLARRAVAEEPHAVRARLYLARIELDRANISLARDAFEEARASAALRRRVGLREYEKELLAAPSWQFDQIEEALR